MFVQLKRVTYTVEKRKRRFTSVNTSCYKGFIKLSLNVNLVFVKWFYEKIMTMYIDYIYKYVSCMQYIFLIRYTVKSRYKV